LDRAGVANVVLDPVMKSTSGDTDLWMRAELKYISEELLKRVTVVTPNIAEAEILSGICDQGSGWNGRGARRIVERGARAVVVKAPHDKAIDILFDGLEVLRFGAITLRVRTRTDRDAPFGSAIAAQLACGRPLREAVLLAKA